MNYAPYQTLVAPARPTAQAWRLLAGIVLTFVIYFVLSAAWIVARSWTGMPLTGLMGQTPASAVELLLSFACLYPGLILALRVFHRRGLGSLFGPFGQLLRDGGRTMLAAVAVYAVAVLIPGPEMTDPVGNLPLSRWIGWLLPALAALLIQITAEELTFRGYLQSQLAARFSSPVIWMVLPAVGFGLLHYNPTEMGENALWMTLPAIGFGLVAADLTARTGTLGPALALHFLNNFVAILLVAPGDMMSGLALWRLPITPADPAMLTQLPVEMATLVVLWLAVRVALRR